VRDPRDLLGGGCIWRRLDTYARFDARASVRSLGIEPNAQAKGRGKVRGYMKVQPPPRGARAVKTSNGVQQRRRAAVIRDNFDGAAAERLGPKANQAVARQFANRLADRSHGSVRAHDGASAVPMILAVCVPTKPSKACTHNPIANVISRSRGRWGRISRFKRVDVRFAHTFLGSAWRSSMMRNDACVRSLIKR